MKKLKINPQVFDDLEEIRNYIAEDSQEQANKVVRDILADMERLRDFPDIGAKLSNKVHIDAKYRYLITYSYATVYYSDEENVYITTVLHLARDFSAIDFK